MSFEKLTQLYLDGIEEEMKAIITKSDFTGLEQFHHMMAYHLGWEGTGAGEAARGKRIRPILVLLVNSACDGNWQEALPAAAAVELVHNFSLIHDDIEDNSPLRRGRDTVWKLWGIAQAINTGDAMLILAFLALNGLKNQKISHRATELLLKTCLSLTQGQFLDISYEKRNDINIEEYFQMIKGKTAALIATSCELGALIAEIDLRDQQTFRQFGEHLGLAFQAHDDYLGIWGDEALTGKSSESDLVSGKKSLPILYGLKQSGKFAEYWKRGSIHPEEIAQLTIMLEEEGAKDYTLKIVQESTYNAQQALKSANPKGEAAIALFELIELLLNRNK